ncbi:MAG: divergent PAP2 family protein [Lachnospiraceae bacterium]|nr:divergent PAP2 family protein [Lachnospiraceae bacterium]
MRFFSEIICNKVLLTSVGAWFFCQVIKTIINFLVTKKWDFERLVGSGGMPSCHSATVCSLAVASGYAYGFDSFQFAVTTMLAIIVMYDARGVRQETGKQAVVIKQITEYLEKSKTTKHPPEFDEEMLKELVGHTFLQVVVGATIGIIIGIVSGTFWI